MMKKTFASALVALLPALGLAAERATWEAQAPVVSAAPANTVAIHDPDSPSYDPNCLSCHADVLKETSLDPRVPSIHQEMVPYTPGFNPRKGITNEVCVKCHRSVDIRDGSAAGLRIQVTRENCALCHRPVGPGKALYK